MKKEVRVVAAVIIDENKVFCAKRNEFGDSAFKWEFPGGKIDNGETPSEALKRELYEELKIDTIIGEALCVVHHEYPSFIIELHAYLATIVSGKIVLTEHIDSEWVDIKNLMQVDFAEADKPVVTEIIKRYLVR